MEGHDLCDRSAVALVAAIRRGELSARELMDAHLGRIERLNPLVNAIVTLDAQRAREHAAAADEAQVRDEPLGPLHGLPIAHKDLLLTRGMRTTFGSPLLREFVPAVDALLVERLRRAGAIALGKTNVPEFGAGSQTYNEVFGETRNPYDLRRTCGGSSGGAAVALACGMVPIADGSDLGGSLRNPASFCNVTALRPSPGRVPSWPSEAAWFSLAVEGPMARSVEDVALLLSVMAGPDPRCPISLSEPGHVFARPLERDLRGMRLAWSPDLGELPVDRHVTETIERALPAFSALGCRVEPSTPDFSGADEAFRILRAWAFALSLGDLRQKAGEHMKETLRWNIDEGLRLRGVDVGRAERLRTQLYQRLRTFLDETADFLLLPVSQVPPFALEERWVKEIAGVPMETYLDWMRSCSHVTVTGLPAASVPCGFTDDGLPIGLQIVGRPRDDFGVLQLAWAFEQVTGFGRRRPPLLDAADKATVESRSP